MFGRERAQPRRQTEQIKVTSLVQLPSLRCSPYALAAAVIALVGFCIFEDDGFLLRAAGDFIVTL